MHLPYPESNHGLYWLSTTYGSLTGNNIPINLFLIVSLMAAASRMAIFQSPEFYTQSQDSALANLLHSSM